MKFLDAEFVKGFIRMANDGWEQGWHERNGGNLSYRVKPEEVEEVKENFEAREWNPIGTTVPNLAGEYFLVTGSGKYFRNVTIKPEDSICMIELDEKGENYRIVWGLVNGGRPTSELPSHLMNLEVKKLQDERYRVVYHAHTTNVIALTFVLPLEDKVFTRELWEMATECPVVFPSGIGVVPWMVPGGREIAVATSELMKKYGSALTLYINGYLHDLHEAEDLMIEVFTYLFVKKPRIREGGLKAYLYKSARHMAIRHRKKLHLSFSMENLSEEPESDLLVEEVVKTKEQNEILHFCMKQLQQNYREALYLVYFENMSYAQATEVMGKSVKQITNMVYRGKHSLRGLLEKEGITDAKS